MFKTYRDKSGKARWIGTSSNRFKDRDGEIVSEKALAADVERADKDGDYGPLRWWHVKGLDIGTCDFNVMRDGVLIESGTFKSEDIARWAEKNAGDLGLSIGFTHPADQPDGKGVFTNIRRVERSLLPNVSAANPYTNFSVKEAVNLADPKTARKWKTFVTVLFGGDEKAATEYAEQVSQTARGLEEKGVEFKEKGEKAVVTRSTALEDAGRDLMDLVRDSPPMNVRYAANKLAYFLSLDNPGSELRPLVSALQQAYASAVETENISTRSMNLAESAMRNVLSYLSRKEVKGDPATEKTVYSPEINAWRDEAKAIMREEAGGFQGDSKRIVGRAWDKMDELMRRVLVAAMESKDPRMANAFRTFREQELRPMWDKIREDDDSPNLKERQGDPATEKALNFNGNNEIDAAIRQGTAAVSSSNINDIREAQGVVGRAFLKASTKRDEAIQRRDPRDTITAWRMTVRVLMELGDKLDRALENRWMSPKEVGKAAKHPPVSVERLVQLLHEITAMDPNNRKLGAAVQRVMTIAQSDDLSGLVRAADDLDNALPVMGDADYHDPTWEEMEIDQNIRRVMAEARRLWTAKKEAGDPATEKAGIPPGDTADEMEAGFRSMVQEGNEYRNAGNSYWLTKIADRMDNNGKDYIALAEAWEQYGDAAQGRRLRALAERSRKQAETFDSAASRIDRRNSKEAGDTTIKEGPATIYAERVYTRASDVDPLAFIKG